MPPVARKVLFVSRNPIVHEACGSTTLIANQLQQLLDAGLPVTLLCTLAASRSPRVLFRRHVQLPRGVEYLIPGYWKLGRTYLRLFAIKPWFHDLYRFALRHRTLHPLATLTQRLFGRRIYWNAWDLTPPTGRELALVQSELRERPATNVLANYALWGPLLHRLRDERTNGMPKLGIMMHDLLSMRVQAMQASGTPLDCPEITFSTELEWLDQADYVLAAQRSEADMLRPHTRAEVLLQPIILPGHIAHSPSDSRRVLFVGFNVPPNTRGLEFFLNDVWPRVRAAVPGATLQIAGSISRARLPGFAQPGVEVLGFVDSLATCYQGAAVVIVPLLFGSGIKIKLLEALSYGKAIVSTSAGVQGVEERVQGAVSICDSPKDFARAVIELLTDPHLRRTREQAAAEAVLQWFSPESEPVQRFRALIS